MADRLENGTAEKGSLLRSIILIAMACLVYGCQQGIHDNYGIMMNGLLEPTGIDYQSISFCIGVGALIYGFAQPFMGMLAIKTSQTFVLTLGIALTASGLFITPLCRHFVTLLLFFGITLPLGTTGLALGILMSAIAPIIGEKRAASASGLIQAAAGIGDALMSPGLETMIQGAGVRTAMSVVAIPFLVFVPMVFWMGQMNKKYTSREKAEELKNESLYSIVRDALKDRDVRLVMLAFATCGFNMSIIESHLFSQFLSWGLSNRTAAFAMTMYGIATMVGATAAGYLCTKINMNRILGTVYALRVVASLGILFLPKSAALAFGSTALLGISGDSTPPPTTNILMKRCGAERVGVLYGVALIGHQIGAFLSSYLGGVFHDSGLGFEPLRIVNMFLAAFASICSYRIRGQKID